MGEKTLFPSVQGGNRDAEALANRGDSHFPLEIRQKRGKLEAEAVRATRGQDIREERVGYPARRAFEPGWADTVINNLIVFKGYEAPAIRAVGGKPPGHATVRAFRSIMVESARGA